MNELMLQVERAVRPVQAGPKKKLRMREELLAHLTAIYDEEFAHCGDEAAARAESLRRFGDPQGLTTDLQRSVRWSDRMDARLNCLFGWRAGTSSARNALRMALLVAILVLFFLGFVLLAKEFPRSDHGNVPTTAQLLWLFGSFAICSSMAMFFVVLLTARIRDSIYGVSGAPRSWRRAFGFAGLAFLILPVLGTAFWLTGLPETREMMHEMTSTPLIVMSLPGHLLLALFLVWFAWYTGPEQIRQMEWSSLELGT